MDSANFQILAENIALLSMLSTVPEAPAENTLVAEFVNNDQEPRLLTFQRECDIVDNLAFLSAVSEDAEKVTAVCIEEKNEPPGLKVMLAVNKGDLAKVKEGLETIFSILQNVSLREGKEDEGAKQVLLNEIVSMNCYRLLSRLRSKHAAKTLRTRNKPALNSRLAHVIRLSSQCHPRLDRVGLITVDECRKFLTLFKMLEATASRTSPPVTTLIDIVSCAHNMTTQLGFIKLIKDLPASREIDAGDRASLINRMQKIGRYKSVCDFLFSAARKLEVFQRVEVEVINLPRFVDSLPAVTASSSSTSPSLMDALERLGAQEAQQMNKIRQILGKAAMKLPGLAQEKFGERLRGALLLSKIHAEIQIIYHYEMHPASTNPRVICSSKSACYLCNLFVKLHGKFFVARTHGRLYEKWRLPIMDDRGLLLANTIVLKDTIQNFNAALENSVRAMLFQPRGPILSHPNESIYLHPPTWTPSQISEAAGDTSISDIQLPEKLSNPGREIQELRGAYPIAGSIIAGRAGPGNSERCDLAEKEPTASENIYLAQGRKILRQLGAAGQGPCFIVNRLHLFVGSMLPNQSSCWQHPINSNNEATKPLQIFSIEVEWLKDDEAAHLRAENGNHIVNVETMQGGAEITKRQGSTRTSSNLYIAFDRDIISLKYVFELEDNEQRISNRAAKTTSGNSRQHDSPRLET